MNIEVEIKVKVNNLEEVKTKVSKLGKLIKAIKQIDDYYTPSHRNFFIEKPNPIEFLRIRTNPGKIVLEYDKSINKRASGEQDYAEEYETEILDKPELEKILGFLDFKKVLTVEKNREYWLCGKIEVALDEVKDLGLYVEAEAKGDFKDETEARKACVDCLENLGIKDVAKNQILKGYSQMLFEKLK